VLRLTGMIAPVMKLAATDPSKTTGFIHQSAPKAHDNSFCIFVLHSKVDDVRLDR
jgi:hypothetical protein